MQRLLHTRLGTCGPRDPVDDSKMTSRLVLHLSGAWTKHQDTLIEDGDLLYRMPGLSNISKRSGWHELPRSLQSENKVLLDQYIGLFAGLEDQVSSLPFMSLVNDQFIYSVIPVAAALTEISGIVERFRPRQIMLFRSGARAKHIPATGIVTLESRQGSRDVLGSIVAGSVKTANLDVPIVENQLRGDAMSRTMVRRSTLRLATSLILLRYVFGLLTSRSRQASRQERRCFRRLVLVRSAEHARHAARIFTGISDVGALVTPQFTQGNSEEIRASLEGKIPWCIPETSQLIHSLFVALLPTPSSGIDRIQKLNCGPFTFTASLNELEKDYNSVRFYRFQNSLLRLSLSTFSSVRFTVGFEVQGPFSWIEGCVPRSVGLTTQAIQPVLVQKRNLPIFPFSDCFLTDSAPNSLELANIGALRRGSVEFQGPPFEVQAVKKPGQSMVLGFCTQPYETKNNVRITAKLCEVARALGWTVILRLHPRDNAAQFEAIVNEYPKICSIAKPQPLEDFLDSIDVAVTRTSSVSKEAIARGRLCVNLLLSDYDRMVKADYIGSADNYMSHVITDLDQLSDFLCNPEHLREASLQLQDRLFNGRGFHELVGFLSQ